MVYLPSHMDLGSYEEPTGLACIFWRERLAFLASGLVRPLIILHVP
jgi:hypothetical protein